MAEDFGFEVPIGIMFNGMVRLYANNCLVSWAELKAMGPDAWREFGNGQPVSPPGGPADQSQDSGLSISLDLGYFSIDFATGGLGQEIKDVGIDIAGGLYGVWSGMALMAETTGEFIGTTVVDVGLYGLHEAADLDSKSGLYGSGYTERVRDAIWDSNFADRANAMSNWWNSSRANKALGVIKLGGAIVGAGQDWWNEYQEKLAEGDRFGAAQQLTKPIGEFAADAFLAAGVARGLKFAKSLSKLDNVPVSKLDNVPGSPGKLQQKKLPDIEDVAEQAAKKKKALPGKEDLLKDTEKALGEAADAAPNPKQKGLLDKPDPQRKLPFADAPKTGLRTSELWGNPKKLADHFNRHGADFGARSADDYVQQASRFLQRSQLDDLPTKVDGKGVFRVYDPKTNTFGSFNPDGTIKTFYKPDPSLHKYPTNLDYWNAQPGGAPWTP